MIELSAIVLAGGQSTRMGTSKALLDFEGEPMLSRVVRLCRVFAREVVVVARRGQALPAVDARVVHDAIDGAGPLVGLATGLAALPPLEPRGAPAPWVFVATTDAPFVDARVARALARRAEGGDAGVAVVGGDRHVLHAVYGPRAREVSAALVARGERRASLLAASLDTRWIPEDALRAELPEDALRAFLNVNTLDDLDAARRRTTL